MILNLDWDDITEQVAIDRCKEILKQEVAIQAIELKTSPMGSGYHVYLYLGGQPLSGSVRAFREKWFDDPKRIELDYGIRNENFSVLFNTKVVNGATYLERPFMVFTR
jgi:hypothetical protein